MKRKILLYLLGFLAAGSASAQSLYYVGTEAQEALPLKWVVGTSVTYDDNVNPGYGPEQDSLAASANVALSFINVTPQTTWDVFIRLGLIYYFDATENMDELNSESRAGINLTHRFSERLRFSSRNFISYELEPDYSYGYASSRGSGEYFFWQTDNSLGFRWTERFATYTGLRLSGTTYQEYDDNNSLTWEIYNQCRYQLSRQTVLTFDARYGETFGDGEGTDSTNVYLLIGAEHRFNANTIGIIRAGAQLHQADDGNGNTSSPYVEFAMDSKVNSRFSVRSYARYGIENSNTVQFFREIGSVQYDDAQTLRFGVSGEYAISPRFSIVGGLDYIPTSFADGRSLDDYPGDIPDADQDIINAYIGISMKLSDRFYASLTYNYTDSTSDFEGEDYNRNRISLGLSAEF